MIPRWRATRRWQSTTAAPPRRSRLGLAGLAVGLASSFYLLGAFKPPQLITILSPRPAPPSPSFESEEGHRAADVVEKGFSTIEEVRRLRRDPQRWKESRPYSKYPEDKRVHSLSAGALRGPGKFAVPPLAFVGEGSREANIFLHLGRSMCGHDGIVHGGLSAVVCDEGLARVALPNLPSGVGVTAYLNITYRAPVFADQFVVFRSRLDPECPPSGRKAWATGTLETLGGQVLVKAEALFVEPKGAALLNTETVKRAMDA